MLTAKRVHYLDIADAFLEPDGTLSKEIMPDSLHLSEEGYRRWADALAAKAYGSRPVIQKLTANCFDD